MERRRQHAAHCLVASLALLNARAFSTAASFLPAKSSATRRQRGYRRYVTDVSSTSLSLFPTRPAYTMNPMKNSSYRTSTQLHSATPEDESDNNLSNTMAAKERALGILVLLTVPLSWGTYVPVVRYLYEIQPPVPGFVFSAAYYLVASLSLLALTTLQTDDVNGSNVEEEPNTNTFCLLGGLELGTYLFIANCLQVLGLKTVPSDRAGFLVQLTTIMVPLVSAALAGDVLAIPIQTWTACLLAFGGVIVMGMDGKDMMQGYGLFSSFSSVLESFSQGDILIVMAAFMYSLHVVRLGQYARETTPLRLAASKATIETILSVGLVYALMAIGSSNGSSNGILAFAQETGSEIITFFSTITEEIASGAVPTSVLVPALGAVLWTGWVTCAYTIYAQSFGQRRVNATDANLIYTVQPIFTAFFAWILLGETLGPAGFVGGGLIGSAVYLVAMAEAGNDDNNAGLDEKVEQQKFQDETQVSSQ